MKKVLCFFTLSFCAAFVFAQNVKPYVVDLNKFPAVNDDKTATFDKATKTVTVTANPKLQYGGNKGVYLWLNKIDISSYNIARVKYKAADFGFQFNFDYDDNNTLEWYEKATYCPTYLNEMIIPLDKKYKKLKGISFQGVYLPHQQFVIESVTFEKVANPVKTDIYLSDEPPVVDTATNVSIDANLDAWDFVKNIGAGLNYQIFEDYPQLLDIGVDIRPNMFSRPTKAQIHFMKESGLNAIRLQTNPGHGKILDKNYRLAPRFIKNIKQVVDWCIEEDMYVILCGPFAEYVTNDNFKKRMEWEDPHYAAYYVNEKDKKESERFLKAVWEQYAKAFNNSYDEHLIFEFFNEPSDMLHEHGWNPKDDCAVCKKDYAILNEYNQLLVDTIRSTGGNNANRFVLINGIWSKWETVTNKNFKMPKDKAKHKLIATYHDYSMGGSAAGDYTDFYKNSVKESIDKRFAALDKAFFSKHIPVLIGEVGQTRRTPILERIKWIKYLTAQASKPNRSCAAVLHNDNALVDDGHFFSGYYDSWKLKWYDKEFVDTLIYGIQGKEFPLSAEFIKKNEVKVESLAGKNLLQEPVVRTGKVNWDNNYKIRSDAFYLSTPPKYKIEFEIEKTGADPFLRFAYIDINYNWHDTYNTNMLKIMKVKGGVVAADGLIKVQSNTVILSIDENLATEFANGHAVFLNGQNIIIKSMKVVE
ncbi:MAG: glycoside hydrolase family 5 protein [Treponema sp.]|nr:glycoside hydrolase family 5 protein [Treponema sp.]